MGWWWWNAARGSGGGSSGGLRTTKVRAYDRTVQRPEDFRRPALSESGYRGWCSYLALRPGGGSKPDAGPGTYVVLRVTDEAPVFLDTSPAWTMHGGPVDRAALEANWVADARVVYIGKANNLSVRVPAMAAFGAGVKAAHGGGRLVWQLEETPDLLFAWRPVRDGFATPRDDERAMIDDFRAAYGKPPFANDPDRRGR